MSLGQQCPPHTGVHVCAYTHQQIQCPASSHRVKKQLLINQHELLNNRTHKNNKGERVSSLKNEMSERSTQVGKMRNLFAFLLL